MMGYQEPKLDNVQKTYYMGHQVYNINWTLKFSKQKILQKIMDRLNDCTKLPLDYSVRT
jgi:hypothetical protein